MTRIISGAARGRRLAVPQAGTRPTSDRVREALFSSLASELTGSGEGWQGLRVLDLFAGTGALGLEALSRGAAEALLVESSRAAARVLEANATAVGCPGATVVVRDARQIADGAPPGGPVGLCFADPPYDWSAAAVEALLARLADAGWLVEGARVIVERPARDQVSPLPAHWTDARQRHYGDTMLWYGRHAAPEASPGIPPESHEPPLGA
jgi:16S rRNA (guanine966-N2)-methyltransferase